MATNKESAKHDLFTALNRAVRAGLTVEDVGETAANFLFQWGKAKQDNEPVKTIKMVPPGALNRRNSD